jgi:hypothetical protein
MFKRLVLLMALVALVCTTADAVTISRGKKGRKYVRRFSLVENLQNDKRDIYDKYGFPIHRHREYAYGRIHEYWTYYEHGLEFVFDEDSNLLETNRFWPENRRERFERFPGY